MGNRKTKYKVGDLADEQRIEMICTARGREQLYLDEIENRARCKAQGCRGRMRMAMDRQDEVSGFVGGLA
ncbi:hypothetical protein [Pseudochrobactrum asaccharolyticum]|uniref:hypothetical protein n=1 Tax=Pseudochrobactrum asaccharolyticum TaxID=354351 RepID=UPI0040415A69